MDPGSRGERHTSPGVAIGRRAEAANQPPSFWRRHARKLLGLALVVLFVHDIFGTHGLLAMRRTQSEIARLRQELGALNAENRQLSEQVQALKTDPKLIERIAREEMGLARRGELIFKLPAPTGNAPSDPLKK